MFGFNFGENVGAYERIDDAKNERERSSENVPAQEVVATFDQPVFPDRQSVVQQSSDAQHIALTGELTLVKMTISSAQAAAALDVEGVAEADLIPGRYEGGFKLWEGGVDLAAFLARDLKGCGDYPILTGHHVIELGCGHGLPGIVALLAGATVHFADYNKEVLQLLTQPSVLTNWRSQKEEEAGVEHPPVRYFSGDWTELCSLLGTLGLAGTYDIVLTAESIYSLEGSRKLLQCIKKCIKKPTGLCLVAAKSFYFGVGGGVAAFLDLLQQDGDLCGRVVHTMDDGLSNKRQILAVRWSVS